MKKILNNSKKGFTLIELLAVIVILAVLALVASTNVFNILDNARRGSFRTEFLSLLEAAQTTAQVDMMNGNLTQATNQVCYSLTKDGTSSLDKNYDNKNNYSGSVLVTLDAASGSLTLKGWLAGSYYTIKNGNTSITNQESEAAENYFKREADTTGITTCGGKFKTEEVNKFAKGTA